jgi:hypothetical protein
MTGRYRIGIQPTEVRPQGPPGYERMVVLTIPGVITIQTDTQIVQLRLDDTDTPDVVGARIGHALAFLEGATDRVPPSVISFGESR